jgi:hypothetical protein
MIRPFDSARRTPTRAIGAVSLALAWAFAGACAEWTPEPPRPDVAGCYRITVDGPETVRAPSPPAALELTDRAFQPARASGWHRFDARAAQEAFLVYADTAYQVAWWWEAEDERRFGVGNNNQAAAFYVEAVVRGDRLEGEMRRWRYDSAGQPVPGPDSWTLPLSGRRVGCEAR